MVSSKQASAKRVSRNKKSYWRKGVNTSDLEAFSENLRENERLGLENKTDSELFFVHKDPTDESGSSKIRTRVELRCFSNLKPNSAVVAFPEQKVGIKATRRTEAKLLKKIANQLSKGRRKVHKNVLDSSTYDLWNEKTKKNVSLPPDLEVAYLRSTKEILPKVPDTVKHATTALPAIEPPHPGQSYNPTFDDHQALLKRATKNELEKIKRERKVRIKATPKGELANEATRFAEACEGLQMFNKPDSTAGTCDQDEESKEEEEEEEPNPDIDATKPFLRPAIDAENRKTRKVRRNELIQKMIKEDKSYRKLENKRMHEVFRLKSISKEVDSALKATNERIMKRKQAEKDKLCKPSRLGKNKYDEPDLELCLSSEIPGSMRLMKTEGNLLEDRYKSLLKRNVVETTKLQLSRRRKYKLKKYTKPSAAEVTVDYIPR